LPLSVAATATQGGIMQSQYLCVFQLFVGAVRGGTALLDTTLLASWRRSQR